MHFSFGINFTILSLSKSKDAALSPLFSQSRINVMHSQISYFVSHFLQLSKHSSKIILSKSEFHRFQCSVVYLNQEGKTLINQRFYNMANEDKGGALVHFDDLTIDKCVFTYNNAKNYGGALFIHSDTANVSITNSNFSGNKANYGGSMFIQNHNGLTSIFSSHIDFNFADKASHYAINSKEIRISSCTITDSSNSTISQELNSQGNIVIFNNTFFFNDGCILIKAGYLSVSKNCFARHRSTPLFDLPTNINASIVGNCFGCPKNETFSNGKKYSDNKYDSCTQCELYPPVPTHTDTVPFSFSSPVIIVAISIICCFAILAIIGFSVLRSHWTTDARIYDGMEPML